LLRTPDDAFLADIIESPDDDSLRLIYADWLEETGQPERAEFIRVQIELACLRSGERRHELEARERVLLEEYRDEWAEPVRRFVADTTFRRGFVEAIAVRAEVFLAGSDSWFQAAPIRRVHFLAATLGYPQRLLPQLVACPHLARLSGLDFRHNTLACNGVADLAASPYLRRLASLDLSGNEVRGRGLEALASSENLSGLRDLKLRSNNFMLRGIRALALSRHVQRLVSLDLSRNCLWREDVEALAESTNFCQLETLGLAHSSLDDRSAQALAAPPHLSRLKWLDLRDTHLGKKGRQALLQRFGNGKCCFS
jgi:uncharacterized protein (TIGR02996 family)